MLAACGALGDMIAAGARILECACGPCIGMGFSPASGGVSVRTFNRNFEGRSGTRDAQIYLASPETAAASAKEFPTESTCINALFIKSVNAVSSNCPTSLPFQPPSGI